jgi:hypothetical protein
MPAFPVQLEYNVYDNDEQVTTELRIYNSGRARDIDKRVTVKQILMLEDLPIKPKLKFIAALSQVFNTYTQKLVAKNLPSEFYCPVFQDLSVNTTMGSRVDDIFTDKLDEQDALIAMLL